MTTTISGRIPPGPAQAYDPGQDLLGWMQLNQQHYGDIYKASAFGSDIYVISSPEYAEYVLLRNWQNFLRKGQTVKRIALSLGNGLISSNGPLWVRQRRMIQPAFTHEAVGALFGTFAKPNLALLLKWRQAARGGATVDVTHDLSATVLEVTLRAIFGDDYDAVAAHFQIIAEESRNLEFATTCNALAGIIVSIADARRAAGREARDILGMMMRARDRDGAPMTDAQLAREALTLVIAGHETTASSLNWTWYLLAHHPDVAAKLHAEMRGLPANAPLVFADLARCPYTRLVLEEALRSYPPLWLMTRKTVAADCLGEYLVPAKTEIWISPYLLQRHPRLWRDAPRFDPERFATGGASERERLSMCPFGAGPRNCIGEYFARVEMQVHLLIIARQLQLVHAETKPAEHVAGVNLLSREHFFMQPQEHLPQAADAAAVSDALLAPPSPAVPAACINVAAPAALSVPLE